MIDGNLYWDTRWDKASPQAKFSNATLEQWRSRGHDTNSVFAEPMFVDAAKNDFRLQADSPAHKLGFKPISLSNVGVRTKEKRD